jgi:glutamine synthetase adenylyltransferase
MGMGEAGRGGLSYHSDLDIICPLFRDGGKRAGSLGPREFRKITNHEYFAKVPSG